MREEERKLKQNYEQEILDTIRSRKSPKVIGDLMENYHANDLADVLLELTRKEREMLYRTMDLEHLALTMEYAETEDAVRWLNEMDYRLAANVLTEIEPDDAADILKECDAKTCRLWLSLMDEETRKNLWMLVSFDEDLIASRMTTNYVTINSDFTVKEAMHSLVAQAADNDNISVLYALDPKGIYYGAIDLKDLIIARQSNNLTEIIQTTYPYVYADEKIEDCIETLKDYSEESIPVLDEGNHILGVITSQDVIEIADEEMSEDYARLGGLTAEEDLHEPLKDSVKKRLPWLSLLLVLGLLVSSVVGLFEQVVAQLTIVMAFQSLILDMSGNVGTQSLAVTIRVLTDEQLTAKEKGHLIFKEMRVGGTNGILLGIAALVFVGLYIGLFRGMGFASAFAISGCIGISLFVAMVMSSLIGTSVPILFKQIGVDPAVASGPLITTITDLVGIVTYYGLAAILLIGILGMGM